MPQDGFVTRGRLTEPFQRNEHGTMIAANLQIVRPKLDRGFEDRKGLLEAPHPLQSEAVASERVEIVRMDR